MLPTGLQQRWKTSLGLECAWGRQQISRSRAGPCSGEQWPRSWPSPLAQGQNPHSCWCDTARGCDIHGCQPPVQPGDQVDIGDVTHQGSAPSCNASNAASPGMPPGQGPTRIHSLGWEVAPWLPAPGSGCLELSSDTERPWLETGHCAHCKCIKCKSCGGGLWNEGEMNLLGSEGRRLPGLSLWSTFPSQEGNRAARGCANKHGISL